jgi:uncharacterized protein (TIGR03437 family)
VTVSSSAAVTFTVTTSTASGGSGWLSATLSEDGVSSSTGTTPQVLYVQIFSSTLAAGSYSGTVTLTPNNGNSPVSIAVTLTVSGNGGSNNASLAASPSQLSFGWEVGQATPPSQQTAITSTGIALPISFTTTTAPTLNCTQTWLQVTSSSTNTPATLTVSINTAGLTPGTCTGSITVTSNTTANGTTTKLIGVALYISSSALLNVSVPTSLTSVSLQQGGRPVQYTIGLSSSDGTTAIPFTAVPTSSNNWLALTPGSGSTPASIIVQITPGTNLSPGSYTGSILITSSGLFQNALTIPIALTITSSSSVTVSPSGSPAFTELQGGALPAAQTLTLTGSTSSTFTTSVAQGPSGGAWLQVSPTNGSVTPSTPATLTLSVAANTLQQGTYASQVTINFQNANVPAVTIAVSLTVGAPASALTPSPGTLSFSYQTGGTLPSSQTVAVTNPAQTNAATALTFAVGSVSDSWISAVVTNAVTPGSVTVSVAPQSLQAGTYNGSFTLTANGAATVTVPVSLFISASTTPQPFIIGNAASGVGGNISPGEIVTIKGSGLGPTPAVLYTTSTLSSPTLGGVEVTFNGYPGTLLYVSATQINVTAPYEIAGQSSAFIVVTNQGVSSAAIAQPVGAASLGLFTSNATGTGQASILNQNYSVNSPSNPALQGSYISVYATGGGQTNPASVDGEVSPLSSLLPLGLASSVNAMIGGKAAPVLFAGAAPGDVTGVVQFNIQVPTGLTSGVVAIAVTINGTIVSQSGATIAIQ